MGKKSRFGSGMNFPDHISECLETMFWVKIPQFFNVDADPGSGNLFDPGSGMKIIRIRDKHWKLCRNTGYYATSDIEKTQLIVYDEFDNLYLSFQEASQLFI
jgi:hypothetical protein